MRSRYFIRNLLVMLVVAVQTMLTLAAQDNPSDSLKSSSPNIARIKRLRKELQQNTRRLDRSVADSLLLDARQLNDPAGEVVALSQIANWQRQNGQTLAATDTQTEAVAVAVQCHDLREIGWAMTLVGGLMQRKNGEMLEPVLTALNDAMQRASVRNVPKENEQGGRFPHQAGLPMALRALPPRNRLATENRPFSPSVSIPFTEKWLDSLVRHRDQPAPDVKQLTEKKKIRDSNRQLSQTFAQRGDYAKAYNYYVQYTAYKDSLAAEVTARQLAAIQFKQANQKKEAQIKLLTTRQQLRDQEANQQRQLTLALVGLAGLLLAFSVTLIRSNRQRHRTNQQLNDRKEALENTLSELKTTQNQLIQSEKMAALGELTAGIAHEIQNPLNFVNNFSEVSTELVDELVEVRDENGPHAALQSELLTDLRQNLQKITQHGGRASAIVKGMLEHSRNVTGEKEPTDLNRLAEEQLQLAYHTMQAKDHSFTVTLTTEFDPNLGLVNVVRQEISRVLFNLYSNAFYALQQKRAVQPVSYAPELRVCSGRNGQQISLVVRDNGTGIPASARDKIFQPFFTTKPTGAGTGLGLSLSYDIITKGYGGTMTVMTEDGQFTEFTVTLPLPVVVAKAAPVAITKPTNVAARLP